MGMERRRSKGSFLSLFDCNGVSRKKLFHSTPNLPDEMKQANENVTNMPESHLNTTKVNENGINASSSTNCDFNCEISTNNVMQCETKVPCLIARLMGLESLPTSTVNNLSLTASRSYSNCFVSSHCHEDAVQSMAQKVENSTIEARRPKNATIKDLDLKQKSEAAHHTSMHEKTMHKDTVECPKYSEDISCHGLESRGNSTLLAIQAKAQCRGRVTSNGNRGQKQREQNEITSNQFLRTQKPIPQQAMKQRACARRSSHFNEIGQNSTSTKVRSTSIVESSKPTPQSSIVRSKKVTNNNLVMDNVIPSSCGRKSTGAKKEILLLKTKSNSMRKRDVLPVNVANGHEGKFIKCNVTTEGSMNRYSLNNKAGKDVISFTFTSPLKKQSQPSTQTNNVHVNASSLHKTNGDNSSDLFNGKAQDLASRIKSMEYTLATWVPSAVSLPSDDVSTESREGDIGFHSNPMLNMNQKLQVDMTGSCNQSIMQGAKAKRQSSRDNNIETEDYQGLNIEQLCGLLYSEDYNRPRKSKLELVKGMLSSENLVEESLASVEQKIRNEQVIKTNVCDVLDKWTNGIEERDERVKVDERNLLFDFVSEFLELRRCKKDRRRRALGSQIWWEEEKEEMCNEMKRFKSMQEMKVVDELVNMDMNSPHGTWFHFQTDLFLQILLPHIEWDISTSLINDLLLDLFHY